jgi:isopentenyldiphosphate isomerase
VNEKKFQGNEVLEIWDWEKAVPTGKSVLRGDAHSCGCAHEGVHLWIIRPTVTGCDVLFQERASHKEQYPGYLDITVGGHVPFGMVDNKIQKESMEEIGISPGDDEMIDLGYFRYEERTESLFHREFQKVYLYESRKELSEFRFTDGEVSGIYAVPFEKLETMMQRDSSFSIEGFNGTDMVIRDVGRRDFHPLLFAKSMDFYMKIILAAIHQLLETGTVTVMMPAPV